MVLLLDNFAAFNEKCVGDLQRLAVRQADLGLAGNPPTLTCVVTQKFKAAYGRQNASEKV